MAYYLDFSSDTDNSVQSSGTTTLANSGKITKDFTFSVSSNLGQDPIFQIRSDAPTANKITTRIGAVNRVDIQNASATNVSGGGTYQVPLNTLIRVVTNHFPATDTFDAQIYEEGVLVGEITGGSFALDIPNLDCTYSIDFTDGSGLNLYEFKVLVDDVEVLSLDPSASNGTGSTLPDTVGANDGTLVNFPTDDSQWVWYSNFAIDPTQWGRRVEITEAQTSPTLSGYVGLITEANLPAEIWTLAENGGGDLRVCLNSDGTGQLPLEVVTFDTVGQTAVLWTRFPTFAAGSSLWLFYDKAGEI